MNILATVIFSKKQQVTAAWEFLPGEKDSFLVITTDQRKNPFVIRLNNQLVKDQPGVEVAQKHYVGSVNASDAFLMNMH
jgi:hypothetical protein